MLEASSRITTADDGPSFPNGPSQMEQTAPDEPDPIIALWAKRQALNEEAEHLYRWAAQDEATNPTRHQQLQSRAHWIDDRVDRIDRQIARMSVNSPYRAMVFGALLLDAAEAGSPRDGRDKVMARKLDAYLRQQAGEPVAPRPESVDPLAEAGAELRRLHQAWDVAISKPSLRGTENDAACIYSRQRAVEAYVSTLQATSLEGAIVQVAQADAILSDLLEHALPEDMNDFEKSFWKDRINQASRNLHSVANLIEALTGADRETLGTVSYMAPWMDPFVPIERAISGRYDEDYLRERQAECDREDAARKAARKSLRPAQEGAAAG